MVVVAAAAALACGALPYTERPAAGYTYASREPLVIGIIDLTGGSDWTPSVRAGEQAYADGTPHLRFQDGASGANIVITVHQYTDHQPPTLPGYTFQPGVAGFAAVYDADGKACNFPPSPLPENCSGELARADVYLNDAIAPGADVDARRLRLVLHEFGHAMGLTRHSPSLDIAMLTARYGW